MSYRINNNKEKIEQILKNGCFECLCCPNIEKNVNYLLSEKGVFCNKCGGDVYYSNPT